MWPLLAQVVLHVAKSQLGNPMKDPAVMAESMRHGRPPESLEVMRVQRVVNDRLSYSARRRPFPSSCTQARPSLREHCRCVCP